MKSNYSRIFLAKWIHAIDNGKDKFAVSLLDAINFLHVAREKVLTRTIANCYAHAGFSEDYNSDRFDAEDGIPLIELLRQSSETIMPGIDVELSEYIRVDEDLISTERLTDEQILTSFTVGK